MRSEGCGIKVHMGNERTTILKEVDVTLSLAFGVWNRVQDSG